MREFLKGLELEKETIDTIMAEHGKLITEAKEKRQELEDKIKEYEGKIEDLGSKAKTNEEIQKELETLKGQIAEETAKKQEAEKEAKFLNNINEVIGDKKFVNDFTKNAIINEIKTALQLEENAGKSTKDIFEALTKDKVNIFANPNKVADMPAVGDTNEDKNTKDIPLIW